MDIMSKFGSDRGPESPPGYVRIVQCKSQMVENLPKLSCIAITLRCMLSLLPTKKEQIFLALATDAKEVRMNV